MRILVTGGAGFIASHIVDAYIEAGHEVTVIDTLVTGFKDNLNSKATFVHMDILDPELKDVFDAQSFDVINHHAAQIDVRKSIENPFDDLCVNGGGVLNLLEQARLHGVKKIIYASTGGAIYGESRDLPLTEDSLVQPICPYGVSKYAAEEYVRLYRRLYDLDYVILRYPNIYGPRQNPKGEAGVNAIFIGSMLKGNVPTIYGDGEQVRDYTYVGDVAAANLLALDHGVCDMFNVSTGVGASVNDVYRILQGITGMKDDAVYEAKRLGEIETTYMASNTIKDAWGWQSKWTLEEGLNETVQWFKEEGLDRFFKG